MRVSRVIPAMACGIVASLAACGKNESPPRASVDSAAGVAASPAHGTLSFVAVDVGRHLNDDRKISDKTDDFAPTDTIFASVHTSGRATNAPVVGRWTFQDGTTIAEQTDSVTTNGDAYSAFFIVRPGGLPKGKYTIHVLVNGRETQAKDATVK